MLLRLLLLLNTLNDDCSSIAPLMWSTCFILPLLVVFGPVCNAQVDSRPQLAVFENLTTVPRGWQQRDAVPPSKILKFRLAIRLENAFAFEQHVLNISTPGHKKYGHHMSRKELKSMVRPSYVVSESILHWLSGEGVTDVDDNGDWIKFRVPVSVAERILDTKSGILVIQARVGS